MPLIDGEEIGTFSTGSVGQRAPLFDLTDEEIAEELEECRAREARRVPMGFRAECSVAAPPHVGTFPHVPRFDLNA